MILLKTTVQLLTRVSVKQLCKISCFQSFTKMEWYAFTFTCVQYLLYQLLVPPITVQYKTELQYNSMSN